MYYKINQMMKILKLKNQKKKTEFQNIRKIIIYCKINQMMKILKLKN